MKSAICKKKKYMNCFRNEILILDKILGTVNSDCGLPNLSCLSLHRLLKVMDRKFVKSAVGSLWEARNNIVKEKVPASN
jgi:hypothetical protein